MIKISIIIPAYNVEGYVQRAIESALNQTIQDKEIIVVNDGSTDNTLHVLQKFSKDIIVIDKKNEGVSVARNVGLEKSQGEYICYLDADDFYVSKTILEEFYAMSKQNDLDVIRGAYKIFDETKNEYKEHLAPNFPKINKVLSGQEFLVGSIKYSFNEVVPWLGLYKRKYLIDNNLMFPKGIAYEEDQLMFLKAMLLNGKFMQTDKYFYTYVYRQSSCARNLDFSKAKDVAFIVKEELNLITNQKLTKEVKKASLKYCSSSFYQLTSIYGRVNNKKRKDCVKLIPFKMRLKLMCNPYNSYHFKKIFLFNFARIVLDKFYDRRKDS